MFAKSLRDYMYLAAFFSIGNGLMLLKEYPISVRCRDIIDRVYYFPNFLRINFASSTAV
jgi:hypothetical protein